MLEDYLGREWHEGQDAYYEKVDVGNAFELVQERKRRERQCCVALSAYSVAVEIGFLLVARHAEVNNQRVLPLFL